MCGVRGMTTPTCGPAIHLVGPKKRFLIRAVGFTVSCDVTPVLAMPKKKDTAARQFGSPNKRVVSRRHTPRGWSSEYIPEHSPATEPSQDSTGAIERPIQTSTEGLRAVLQTPNFKFNSPSATSRHLKTKPF